MKKIKFCIFAMLVLLLVSCGNNSKDSNAEVKSVSTTTVATEVKAIDGLTIKTETAVPDAETFENEVLADLYETIVSDFDSSALGIDLEISPLKTLASEVLNLTRANAL